MPNNRNYGRYIGERVRYAPFGSEERYGYVVGMGGTDNNACQVQFDGEQKAKRVVAEWCDHVEEPNPIKSLLWLICHWETELYHAEKEASTWALGPVDVLRRRNHELRFILEHYTELPRTADQILEAEKAECPPP